MKIGKILNFRKIKDFNGSVDGPLNSAFSISVGKSKSYLYEDSGGKKLHLSKIESGQEGNIGNMVRAMTEADIKSKKRQSVVVNKEDPVTKISVNMNNVADLNLLHTELKKIDNQEIEFVAEGLNGREFSDLKNYLETASEDRSDNENYNQILSLLDQANRIDQQDSKTVADANELLRLNKAIKDLIPSARSTKAFKKEERNKALDNLNFLLNREGERLNLQKARIQNSKLISLNRSEARRTPELSTQQPGDFSLKGQQGTSGTYEFKTKDGDTTIATFKPESQELRAINGQGQRGEGAIREIVGFELSRQQGFSVVPDTRLAAFTNSAFTKNGNPAIPDSNAEKQVGTMQAHPENSDGNLAAYLNKPQENQQTLDHQSLQEMAILNIMTLNTGRKREDIQISTDGKLHAVNQNEMVPDVNRFKEIFDNEKTENGFAWAKLPEANIPFPPATRNKILQMDIDQIVNNINQRATETSTKLATVTGEDPNKTRFSQDQLDMMRFSGRLLKLAAEAQLTPTQIESIFKKRIDENSVAYDPNDDSSPQPTIGGEFADFLNATFLKNKKAEEEALKEGKPVPEREMDFAKAEDTFRELMSLALSRLKVDLNALEVPDNVLSRPKLNEPGVQGVPAQNGNQAQRPTGLLERYMYHKQRLKDKKIVGNIIDLNTNTASDVYRVTTQGPIDKTGTNQGFAKKAIKKGDQWTDGTANLNFAKYTNTEIRQSNGALDDSLLGKLKEHPNLIARQVMSSRLDRAMGTNTLAREVFSKDQDGGVLGITARVPGKALKEQGDEETGKPDLYRNFDFSQPATQKGLSDLQLMDALTGQIDRHGGNIFIDPETGRVYGIDNDLAFPKDDEFRKDNMLKDQFSVDQQGTLVYNQDLIDAETARSFLDVNRDELEGILRGRRKDPESLDEAAIQKTLERYDAIRAKILLLKGRTDRGEPNGLVTDWNNNTFLAALGASTQAHNNNYIARSVFKFTQAGDPNIKELAQEL